jgi:hypothetical protein
MVDIGYLQSLTKRTRYSAVIAAVAVFSLLLAIWVALRGNAHMKAAVHTRSAAEPGVSVLTLSSYRFTEYSHVTELGTASTSSNCTHTCRKPCVHALS